MENLIYLDHAATTPLSKRALEKMLPYFSGQYANASAAYSFAQQSRGAVEEARAVIAKAIGAQPSEIYFTSGATESDNWAIKAAAWAFREKGKHIITTKIEHHAVLETCEYLEQCGFSVTYVAPDEHGIVDAADVEAAIRPDTILISVMFANNEIGTIQPIRQIGQMAKEHGILFHTDAVQAVGHLPVDVKECGIDLLCASAHKFQGPKGTGFCYIKSGVKIGSLLHGGAQERHRRAGTLNVPGIVGMGEALKEALEQLEETMEYERNLRDYLVEQLTGQIPDTRLNGAQEMRLPNNANLYFKGVRGEAALIQLDRHGICCSTGSACTTGAADASHVLTAIGLSEEEARCCLRFSLSAANTKEEIEKTIEVVKEVAARIRGISLR